MKAIRKHAFLIVSAIMLMGLVSVASADMVIDNFNAGNIVVDHSVSSSFGNPVPNVFGGNRAILFG